MGLRNVVVKEDRDQEEEVRRKEALQEGNNRKEHRVLHHHPLIPHPLHQDLRVLLLRGLEVEAQVVTHHQNRSKKLNRNLNRNPSISFLKSI